MTVGRTLKRRGLIDKRISGKRSKSAKYPKTRYPRGMKISKPGDMIQTDTKYIILIGGRKYYQFTAIDVLSKKKVMRIYKTQSSKMTRYFWKNASRLSHLSCGQCKLTTARRSKNTLMPYARQKSCHTATSIRELPSRIAMWRYCMGPINRDSINKAMCARILKL